MKACCLALLALAPYWLASNASAQPADSWRIELAATSDYIFRGFSRSAAAPALQAGLRYQNTGGWFAGVWASTVDFDYDDPLAESTRRLELQAFSGYHRAFGPNWSASALLVRYLYPDTDPQVDKAYGEVIATLYYRELLSLSVAYTPGFLSSPRSGLFFELSGRYPLAREFELSAGIGRGEVVLGEANHYTYGHLSVGRGIGRYHFDLGYYLADAPSFPRWGEVADGNWAFMVSTRWP